MLKCLRSVLFVAVLFLLVALSAFAQSPAGRWVTVDDETGEQKSIVTIYEADGELFGRVEQVFPRAGQPADPVCVACSGALKDQPITGMRILWDMEPDGDKWSGGKILDPEKGKVYRCKIWLEGGKLRVRGYLGPLHRTQTWLPATHAGK